MPNAGRVKLFASDLHDDLGGWALGYVPYGGPDVGELRAVADAVGEGDDSAFYQAWIAAGDRAAAEAEASRAKGHPKSAGELYLRASCLYGSSYRVLFGEPVDPRLVAAYRKQVAAFDAALPLAGAGAYSLRIPFEETTMPAYFVPAYGYEDAVRPLLILNNGYDATFVDLYFASAVAAARRGYHCLLFDGPGQGEMLFEQGIRMRPDWEVVINAVVDAALKLPHVDTARIALSGWSLGGYLAPRGASGEPRLAACIADPGFPGIAPAFRMMAQRFGATPDMVTDLDRLDKPVLEKMSQAIQSDPKMRWTIERRGFWVHGVRNLQEYASAVQDYTMEGRAASIACPTLLARAENDPLSAGVQSLYDALHCPKDVFTFTAAEGAGMHCEMLNRSLFHRRALDWLDERFGSTPYRVR